MGAWIMSGRASRSHSKMLSLNDRTSWTIGGTAGILTIALLISQLWAYTPIAIVEEANRAKVEREEIQADIEELEGLDKEVALIKQKLDSLDERAKKSEQQLEAIWRLLLEIRREQKR